MAEDLAKRIGTFLGEFRILVPALAVLLGFQLQIAFSAEWEDMPTADRVVDFAAVLATTTALALLLVPTSVHRMTAELEISEDFLLFAQRSVALAFVFLAASIVLSLALQARRVLGTGWPALGVAAAVLVGLVAAWWVVPHRRLKRAGVPHREHG